MSTAQHPRVDPQERERKLNRYGALGCTAVVVLSFASILTAASGSNVDRTPQSAPDRAEQLLDLHQGASTQTIAVILRAAAFLVLVGVSLYLWDIVKRRDGNLRPWIKWTGIVGPPLVAATTIAGLMVLIGIADDFVGSGAQTAARADDLVRDSGSLRFVRILEITTHTVLGAWCAGISYYAMRVGLLTRFLGVWGIGAGAATAVLPIGDALFLGWIGSVALLAYGYWPGDGRPPAWDRGVAVPWDAAGQPVTRDRDRT